MRIIDAHQEIAVTNVDDEKLFSFNFNPETQHSVEGCILTESRQNLEENSLLLNLSNRYSFIKAVIGWVDLNNPAAVEQLAYYSSHSKFAGIRFSIKENNLKKILTPSFNKAVSFLSEHNLTFDFHLEPQYLKVAKELSTIFQDQKFILNYMGKPRIKEGILIPWADDIFHLAESPNVFCKLMGTGSSKVFDLKQVEPFFSVVLHAFGFDRIMFGSSSHSLADEYSQILEMIDNTLIPFPDAEKSKIWGQNAIDVYGIR